MDTKDIKGIEIVAPEGYEIDNEKSTLERIVFKKKDDKPRSWEEFCERGFTGEEAYMTNVGAAQTSYSKGTHRNIIHIGYVDHIEEAEAFVALMQLRQLRKAWVGDWEPDWNENSFKCVIEASSDKICVGMYCTISRCLSFPNKGMANEFIECFKDLLEQAKMLL